MPRTECYCGESIKAFIVFGAANLFLEIGVKLIVIVHDYVIIFCSLRDEKETNELKRNIFVLKSSYLSETEKQFIQQLSL